ncbi:MAG: autotransporter-associated beta strand repeat-containing protein [Chthoniobacterales bacterium]
MKSGSHVLTVSGDNAGMGEWLLEAGTLKFGSATAAGKGVTTTAAATIDLNGQNLSAQPLTVLEADTTMTNSSATAATWNGTIALPASGDFIFDVSAGALEVTGAITSSSAGSIVKNGSGTVTLSSMSNNYHGNTTINAGEMILTGRTVFYIGNDGVNNSINGSGDVTFGGEFAFDLAGAGSTIGDSWNVVDVGNLGVTWDGGFSVFDFTNSGGGIWTGLFFGSQYEFSELTGQLSVVAVPEPGVISLIALAGASLFAFRRFRRSR